MKLSLPNAALPQFPLGFCQSHLTEEGFKHKFKTAKPETGEAPTQFIARPVIELPPGISLALVTVVPGTAVAKDIPPGILFIPSSVRLYLTTMAKAIDYVLPKCMLARGTPDGVGWWGITPSPRCWRLLPA